MSTRAALPARYHRDGRRPRGHPGRRPHRVPAAGEESAKKFTEPSSGRRGRRGRDAVGLVPAQVLGERPAAHRVPDRRDGVGEQPACLAQRQFTLVAPGKARPGRPPAGSAEHALMLGAVTDKAGPDDAQGKMVDH